jgi:hypothetical protein
MSRITKHLYRNPGLVALKIWIANVIYEAAGMFVEGILVSCFFIGITEQRSFIVPCVTNLKRRPSRNSNVVKHDSWAGGQPAVVN